MLHAQASNVSKNMTKLDVNPCQIATPISIYQVMKRVVFGIRLADLFINVHDFFPPHQRISPWKHKLALLIKFLSQAHIFYFIRLKNPQSLTHVDPHVSE